MHVLDRPNDVIGSRADLKSPCPKGRVGSSPTLAISTMEAVIRRTLEETPVRPGQAPLGRASLSPVVRARGSVVLLSGRGGMADAQR